MVRVGIAGIGFMGWIHWLAWQQVTGAQVTAICSRDPVRQAGDWTGIQGNFGPPGEQVDLQGLRVHKSLDSLFADDSVDLVDLCLPPGIHASATLAALQQGRHVLCEKPMALHVPQCREMLVAARQAQRQLLVAHVLPFFPEYAFVRQLVDGRQFGNLLGGDFRRTVANPQWIEGFFDPHRVGGPLLDLHVHDAHFIRILFGMPTSVTGCGRLRNGLVEYASSLISFPGKRYVVSCNGGVVNQQGRPFTHGFEIHFEQATVQFEFAGFSDCSELMPLKVLTADGQVLRPHLGDGDPVNAFVSELDEVCQVISGRKSKSRILDGSLAADAMRICEATAESVQNQSVVPLE